jgi:hypothetical protein
MDNKTPKSTKESTLSQENQICSHNSGGHLVIIKSGLGNYKFITMKIVNCLKNQH